MQEVILRDGVFLSERHTVQQMRRGAIWRPGVSERKTGSERESMVGVVARARERAKEILQTHQVAPLADDVSRQLDEIMHRARRELVNGG
jgi:trimethylamine:corrinoid methyltransferase-like protein